MDNELDVKEEMIHRLAYYLFTFFQKLIMEES